jgi:hypothetical protein
MNIFHHNLKQRHLAAYCTSEKEIYRQILITMPSEAAKNNTWEQNAFHRHLNDFPNHWYLAKGQFLRQSKKEASAFYKIAK